MNKHLYKFSTLSDYNYVKNNLNIPYCAKISDGNIFIKKNKFDVTYNKGDKYTVFDYTTLDNEPLNIDTSALPNPDLLYNIFSNNNGIIVYKEHIEDITELSNFIDFSTLETINIYNSVTSIGDYAFMYCSGLTSVTIGNSVTSIGNDAFSNCSSLTNITFDGTVSQWNAIEKGDEWNTDVHATSVTCSDGIVTFVIV